MFHSYPNFNVGGVCQILVLVPLPTHCSFLPVRTLRSASRSVCKVNTQEAADVSSLLQLTRSALEQLQSEVQCSTSRMLSHRDLHLSRPLMSVFSVWLPEWRSQSWCLLSELAARRRGWPPAADGNVRPRLRHRLESVLQQRSTQLHWRNCRLPEDTPPAARPHHGTMWLPTNTQKSLSVNFIFLCLVCQELEMIKEVSEASESMNEEVKLLQTQLCYQSRGQKNTFRKFFIIYTLKCSHAAVLISFWQSSSSVWRHWSLWPVKVCRVNWTHTSTLSFTALNLNGATCDLSISDHTGPEPSHVIWWPGFMKLQCVIMFSTGSKKTKREIKSEIVVNDFKIFVFCLSFQNLSSVSFFRKPTGGAYQTSPTLFQLAPFMMTSHLLTSSECHTWNWFSRLMCSAGSGWNLEFVLFMFLMFNCRVCYCHVSECDLHQLQVYPETTCITLIQLKLLHMDQKHNVICKTSYFITNKDSNFRTEKSFLSLRSCICQLNSWTV